MACSRPAMEMDLSAQACLLIREALALKTAKMEEVMEQLQCCNLPLESIFFRAGCGLLWRPEIAGRLGGTRSAA